MRKPRIEIKGGLYNVITRVNTRVNNRQRIFGADDDDYRKFLLDLAGQRSAFLSTFMRIA